MEKNIEHYFPVFISDLHYKSLLGIDLVKFPYLFISTLCGSSIRLMQKKWPSFFQRYIIRFGRSMTFSCKYILVKRSKLFRSIRIGGVG
ncbi:hypothetical protein Y032_0245g3539 [Ancylostoma ceylanicum]|uniref:Uncharacterized protein n=1 Tax=Ancylostoma ceylanicum TaxID=53326 RepID=A0A016SDU2_9BILA|nr:hypothetical protein Y032_0245g3539 [Ancylostoma ceylanicum]